MRCPCIGCDLEHECKNNPVCEACELSQEYDDFIRQSDPTINVEIKKKEDDVDDALNKDVVRTPVPCRNCGELFTPGKSGVWKNYCRTCGNARIQDGRAKSKKATVPQSGQSVVVDFSDHPDLYGWLCNIAKSDFRSPDQMLLWVLSRMMEKETGVEA